MFESNVLIIVGIIFAMASVAQGLCGFGFSLMSVGALTVLLGPKTAVPLDLIAASANCFYLCYLLRDKIVYRDTMLLLVLSISCVPLGTLFLRDLNVGIVELCLGTVMIIVVCMSFADMQCSGVFSSGLFKWFAGVSGGMLGGAFNIPGPPLVLYAYNCGWPVRTAIANLQFLFSVMTVITLTSFYIAGLLNKSIIVYGLTYVPVVLVFTFLGAHISVKLSHNRINWIVNTILFILGVSLVVKGIR
jgi:uncharacterized membrane protein YfcA